MGRSTRVAESTVITNVIMVAVTIVLGLALWAYAAGISASSTSLFAAETNKAILQQRSFLNIDHAYYMSSNRTLVLYVYNYGAVELVIWGITVSNGVTTVSLIPLDIPSTWGPSNIIEVDTPKRIFILLSSSFVAQGTTFTIVVNAVPSSLYGGTSQPELNAQWGVRVEYRVAS